MSRRFRFLRVSICAERHAHDFVAGGMFSTLPLRCNLALQFMAFCSEASKASLVTSVYFFGILLRRSL